MSYLVGWLAGYCVSEWQVSLRVFRFEFVRVSRFDNVSKGLLSRVLDLISSRSGMVQMVQVGKFQQWASFCSFLEGSAV